MDVDTTVLVTGATGQLGTELIRLAPSTYRVVALSRERLDITSPRAVADTVAQVTPAWVINAAAYTAVDRAEQQAAAAYAINADGAACLAAAVAAAGSRMIQISTDFVFDGERPKPYCPDDQPNPLNVYGASKLAGETAVHETLGRRGTIVRTAWVYAPERPNFVQSMLRLMRTRDEVCVVADQIGTPTSAASLARAVWRAVEVGAAGILHWTDMGVASRYDFAVAIQEEAIARGLLRRAAPIHPIATSELPAPARRPAFSVLDKASTWEELAMRPEHWRQSLRRILDRLREGDSDPV